MNTSSKHPGRPTETAADRAIVAVTLLLLLVLGVVGYLLMY